MKLERLHDMGAVREDWRELANRSGNPFLTWEWASTWWEHFGAGRRPLLLGARRDDGSLAGIIPLYLASTRPLPVFRLIGHTVADRQGPVCAPEDRALVGEAMRALPAHLPRRHLLILDRLTDSEGWDSLPHAEVVRREASPALKLHTEDWHEFLMSRSRNFREQVRRRERKLREDSGLSYRLSDGPEGLARDLRTLFRLHDARWGGEATLGFGPAKRDFHRSFAQKALAAGWLRLWLAEVSGEPVAAWYGFRYGGAEWYYQSGRDPAWSDSSVGFVLLVHTIRAALEDGMEIYHLLLGDEAYKSRFSTHDSGVETWAIASGLAGRVAVAGARSAQAAPTTRRALKRIADLAGLPAR